MTEKIDHQKVQEYSFQYVEALMNDFFTAEKEFILGNDILTFSDVKQVNFFILKELFVNWQLEMDKLKSSYFDYEHPAAKTAMKEFMNTISRHIKVKKKDMMSIAITAVQETIYLLISPFEFFYADFSQNTAGNIDVNFLENEMKYIKVNKPLMEELISQLKGTYGTQASQDQVIGILESIITQQGITEDPDIHLENFSKLMAVKKGDLLLQTLTENPPVVTSEPEKAVAEPEVIQEAISKEEKTVAEVSDIIPAEKEIIKEVAKPVQKVAEEKPVEDVPLEKLEAKVVETSTSQTEEESISNLEKELDIAQLDEEKPENVPGSLNSNFPTPETVLNDKLKEKDPEPPLAEMLEKQSDPETLLNTMSINHGYMFINELFNGNADEFNLAMERIETCKDFDAAVELLVQKYARPFKWDMNSKEVKELLKVTFRRFR